MMAQRPDENVEPFDIKAWHEHQLRVRDIHLKGWSEGTKLAIEFSRLIVTNLIWINAAGLGSLPVISKFVGVDGGDWTEKRNVLIFPGTVFAFGLFTALLCAFVTYLNLNGIAKSFLAANSIEISSIRAHHPAYAGDQNFRQAVDEELTEAQRDFGRDNRRIRFYYWTAIALGFVSLISFTTACYLLVTIKPA